MTERISLINKINVIMTFSNQHSILLFAGLADFTFIEGRNVEML